MLIFENISLAIGGLWSNKMRALLTMLGIIIGIGSVIGIVTVGDSMTNGISESMQSMGANNITVSLTQKSSSNSSNGSYRMFGGSTISATDYITDDMLERYKERFSNEIQYVSINESAGSGTAKNGTTSANIAVSGVNLDFEKAGNVDIISGRFINQDDLDKQKKVAVVSSKLCTEIFTGQDPIGKEITVSTSYGTDTFYIVGVYQYQESGSISSTSSVTTNMYIPLSTAKHLTSSPSGYNTLTVVTTVGTDSSTFLNQTKNFFAKLYEKNKSFTATASSMESMVESMTSMLSTISIAIAVIAGISLIVGGIGVMNIMLVSITERTREIGTRKALGATNSSIRLQFIVEAVIICAIGGILGVILGIAMGAAGANLLGYAATPSINIILLAVGFSMLIGVFFGYYPANKAAKLDPIEALRYE